MTFKKSVSYTLNSNKLSGKWSRDLQMVNREGRASWKFPGWANSQVLAGCPWPLLGCGPPSLHPTSPSACPGAVQGQQQPQPARAGFLTALPRSAPPHSSKRQLCPHFREQNKAWEVQACSRPHTLEVDLSKGPLQTQVGTLGIPGPARWKIQNPAAWIPVSSVCRARGVSRGENGFLHQPWPFPFWDYETRSIDKEQNERWMIGNRR